MLRTIVRSNALIALAVTFIALVVSAMAFKQVQLAIALALLVLLFGVRMRSRQAGIVTLWIYWLLVPLLRRVVELWVPGLAADPLVVLPIASTALLALMELRENRLNRRARTVLVLVATGTLIGVPLGLTVDPAAAIFASMAYIASLSAFVIGWGDDVRSSRHTFLERLLTYGLVPIALYGIAQYFLPFTPWDAQWVKIVSASGLGSIESPQEDHIRIFGTLNSPFTFAIVLSVGLMFAFGLRRRLRVKMLIILPLFIALALTFVRSAWLSLVVGLLVLAFAGNDRSAGRTVVIVFACVAAIVVVGGSNPTTKAFTDRITSLGSPSSDVSAKDRFSTSARLIPESAAKPIGNGMGQAGLAANLNESKKTAITDIDNGYLALLYQSGPLALLMLLVAFYACVKSATEALSNAPPGERGYRGVILSILVMLLVAQASGDVLFGITGVIFWYLAGLSVAAARVRSPAVKPELPINTGRVSVASV